MNDDPAYPDLGKSLGDLLKSIVEQANKEDASLSTKLEVFKICSQHYANLKKVKGKGELDPTNGATMDAFRQQMNGSASSHGGAQQGDDSNEQIADGSDA